MVTTLITNIGAPCLVFSALSTVEMSPRAFAEMAGAAIFTLAGFTVIGAGVLRAFGQPQRAFLPSLMFANIGNMGLPLNFLAFGDKGLALGVVVFAVVAVAQFTIGAALASGSSSMGQVARIPALWAALAALAFLLADATPPAWITNTTKILGGMTIPIMLITLGVSLARLKVNSLGRSLGLAVLRLVMGFAVGTAVAWVLGLEEPARGVLIVQSAMPVAVFNYLFALRYKAQPGEVASMVLISTAISFVTLPALIWYVL
jgi:predicted permease